MTEFYRVTNHGSSQLAIETIAGERLELAPGAAIACRPARIRAPKGASAAFEIADLPAGQRGLYG